MKYFCYFEDTGTVLTKLEKRENVYTLKLELEDMFKDRPILVGEVDVIKNAIGKKYIFLDHTLKAKLKNFSQAIK